MYRTEPFSGFAWIDSLLGLLWVLLAKLAPRGLVTVIDTNILGVESPERRNELSGHPDERRRFGFDGER